MDGLSKSLFFKFQRTSGESLNKKLHFIIGIKWEIIYAFRQSKRYKI